MCSRRAGASICSIGLVLLYTPLYWEWLQNRGIAAALDPAAAIGAVPSGGYPAAVGATAVAVGATALLCSTIDGTPANIFLTGSLLGAGLGILAVSVLAQIPAMLAIRVGLAGAAPGFASVRGAATTPSQKRLGTVLICLSLVPLCGEYLILGVTTSGWSMYINLVLSVTLIVYTVVLSYPFYRLSRRTH